MPVLLFGFAQPVRVVRTCRIVPNGVGRDDGIGRPLVNGIRKRQGQPAFGGVNALFLDISHALVVAPKTDAPFCLDWAGGAFFDQFDDFCPFRLGEFVEGGLKCHTGAGIAGVVERIVGESAVRRDRLGLPLCQLKRRHKN